MLREEMRNNKNDNDGCGGEKEEGKESREKKVRKSELV